MAKVDIFIPCYNAERFIKQTIESIQAQTYQDYRVMIIDDGSTDHSLDIIQDYAKKDSRVHVFQNDGNKGVAYTRNRGLEICDSEYMAFMDADDIMPSYRLEHQIEYMDAHPECDVLSGNYQLMDESGNIGQIVQLGRKNAIQVYSALFFENVIANGTVVFRNRVIKNTGVCFNEELITLEDYDFWVQLMFKKLSFFIADEVWQYYRVVEDGLSRSNSSQSKRTVRNTSFNDIHLNIMDNYNISLKEKEIVAWLLFASERELTRMEKMRYFYPFHSLISKLIIQNPYEDNGFVQACEEFKRKYYRI